MPISRKSFVLRLLAAVTITAACTAMFMSCGAKIPDIFPCPGGTTGTWPNCLPSPDQPPIYVCPPGTVGTPPVCRPIDPEPPPLPVGCIRLSPSTCTLGLPGDFRDSVNAALSRATGLEIGNTSVVPNWQEAIVKTMSILQVEGFCTSFDLDSGDCWKFASDGSCLKKGLGSEMGLRRGMDKTEFYQPITATKRARWADARSVCRPAMDEEGLTETRAYLEVSAVPPPTPAPTPGPTPTPEPSPGACPLQLPLPEPYVLEMRIGPHGSSGQQWDATPYIKGPSSQMPPPGWTGSCRTQQCDLSPEKDPQHGAACTLQLCGAAIEYTVLPSSAGFVNWTNGYTVKLTLTGPAVLMGKCPVSGVVQSINVP